MYAWNIYFIDPKQKALDDSSFDTISSYYP